MSEFEKFGPPAGKSELYEGKIEGFEYDQKYRRFPEIIKFNGKTYDLREDLENGNGWYRMMNESRIFVTEAPNYIEVDKNGNIVRIGN